MKKQRGRQVTAWTLLTALAALAGCANFGTATGEAYVSAPDVSRYRCDGGVEFTVRFGDGTAIFKGGRGDDLLLRDAGGQGAQTVYSNPRMCADFGLGASGHEAKLQYSDTLVAMRCLRD